MSAGRLDPAAALVERGLAAARGSGCVVLVEEHFDADQRFANNTTTTNGVRRGRTVAVASFAERPGGTGVGVASSSGADDVVDLVRAAEADAASAEPAPDASPLPEGVADADFDEAPIPTSLGVLGGILGPLGEAFARARAAGHVLAGFATHAVTTTYLGTSAGVRRRHVQPTGTVELVARSDDGRASAWTGAGTEDFRDCSLETMEARLVERLGWSARQVELPAGRYEVVLPPDAVADLVILLAEACGSRDARDGRSAFSAPGGGTRVGERLFDLAFDLFGDPARRGITCAPFLATPVSGADTSVFDNGADVTRMPWIAGGHLAHLREHRAAAREHGTPFAPWVDNLVLELPGSTGGLDDLVAHTERGLLLTCCWYIREVDVATLLLTGLTRDGVYLVEGGEVVGAVNNFRFNESPIGVLERAVEAGRTERALSREWGEWMSRTAMPSLRVADFNMSTVSPAS